MSLPRVKAPPSRAGLVFAIVFLTALYLILIAGPLHRKMWFDELFTYYIAQSATLSRLNDAATHVDLNPPLIYLLVRFSQTLFGASELATRLPAALGFYLGSIGVFLFLRRRIGTIWSTAAVLLFWATPYIKYATLARPYGLLAGFFSLTLLAYDEAATEKPKPWAVACLAAGNIGMMLSHVFAPLSIFPFCVAEAVRSVRQRRLDWKIWASLLLPLALAVLYLPGTHNFQQLYFPAAYQASGEQILNYHLRLVILNLFPGAVIAAALALVALPFSAPREVRLQSTWPVAIWAAILLLMPVMLNLILMRTGGAFWDRYCITSALTFYVLVVVALGRLTGFRAGSGMALVLTLCTLSLVQPWQSDSHTPNPGELQAVRRDLPLVTAGGLTFLEMDRYEKIDLISRLYYLVDRDAAIHYAHSTIFENMPLLTRYFPIRAHVAAYDAFVADHPHFMVLARSSYHDEWLLDKLRADGANVKFTASLRGPAEDFQLYEIQR